MTRAKRPRTASTKEYSLAVGLQYDELRDSTPLVSLKGHNLRAHEIVKLAKRYGVPVVEEAETAEALDRLDLDQEIPPELYQAVAIVLGSLEQGR